MATSQLPVRRGRAPTPPKGLTASQCWWLPNTQATSWYCERGSWMVKMFRCYWTQECETSIARASLVDPAQYCLSSCTTHNGCSQFKVSCNLSTPCTAALADMLFYRRIDSPEFCKFKEMFQFALLYTPKCTLFSFSYSFDPSPTITDSLAVPASSCLVYTTLVYLLFIHGQEQFVFYKSVQSLQLNYM